MVFAIGCQKPTPAMYWADPSPQSLIAKVVLDAQSRFMDVGRSVGITALAAADRSGKHFRDKNISVFSIAAETAYPSTIAHSSGRASSTLSE